MTVLRAILFAWALVTVSPVTVAEISEEEFSELDRLAYADPEKALSVLAAQLDNISHKNQQWSRVALLLVEAQYHLGKRREAEDLISRTMRATHELSIEARLFLIQGRIYASRESLQAAENYYNRVLDIAEQLNDQGLKAEALAALSVVLVKQYDYRQAKNRILEAYELLDRVAKPRDKAALLMSIGEAWYSMDEIEEALKYIAEAKEQMLQTEMPQRLSVLLYNEGVMQREAGQLETALATFEEAETQSIRIQDENGVDYARYAQAGVLNALEEYETAKAILSPLITKFKQRGDIRSYFIGLNRLAKANYGLEQYDQALAISDRAKAVMQSSQHVGLTRYADEMYEVRVDVLEKLNNEQALIDELKDYNHLLTKIYKKDELQQAEKYQAQLQNQLLELQRLRLEKENQMKDSTIEQEKQTRLIAIYVSAFAVIGVIVMGYLGLKNYRLRLQLERISTVDPVTQLPNRESILHHFEKEFDRYERYHEPCCLAMIEVTNYEDVQNQYSDKIANEMMQSIAKIFNVSTRINDVVGRYDDNRFMMILPHTETASSTSVLQRLSDQIESDSNHLGKLALPNMFIGLSQIKEGDEGIHWVIDRASQATRLAQEFNEFYREL